MEVLLESKRAVEKGADSIGIDLGLDLEKEAKILGTPKHLATKLGVTHLVFPQGGSS